MYLYHYKLWRRRSQLRFPVFRRETASVCSRKKSAAIAVSLYYYLLGIWHAVYVIVYHIPQMMIVNEKNEPLL